MSVPVARPVLCTPPMLEDMHVHSTFSDGRDDLATNVGAAEGRGLLRMACVDHVRVDTDWLPEFTRAVRELDNRSPVELLACVEAKILDSSGRLDIPRSLAGVDRVYIADHQVPWIGGCRKPAAVRREIQLGQLRPIPFFELLVEAILGAVRRHPGAVLAHLFSIVPKVGLSEDDIPLALIEELAFECARQDVDLEIDERWRCPSPRVVAAFAALGVPVLASTDSHRADTIGRYRYVQQTLVEVQAIRRDERVAC
ncbi:MAG: histidinol-phosphatase [Myxococcota bacterium]